MLLIFHIPIYCIYVGDFTEKVNMVYTLKFSINMFQHVLLRYPKSNQFHTTYILHILAVNKKKIIKSSE